jgi:transcriptional regulator GlxA family with amidase domain
MNTGIECFITHSTAKGNFIGQEYGTSAIRNEHLFHLFDMLSDQLPGERDAAIVHHLLSALLFFLVRELRENRAVIPWMRHLDQPVPHSRDIMMEARNRIESHLHQKLTLDKLARLLAVSPSTLKRRFRTEMGQTFNQYLTAKRMEGAEILLRDSPLPVDQVASKVGFTYEHLRFLFARIHGCSPGEYRKRNN